MIYDAAIWTGRTGEWRRLMFLKMWAGAFVFAWDERDHGTGLILPAYGIAWGLDFEYDETSLRLYWGYHRPRFFRRPGMARQRAFYGRGDTVQFSRP